MTADDWKLLIGLYVNERQNSREGICDPVRKKALFEKMHVMDEDECRLTFSRYFRDNYLSEEALALKYGIEDLNPLPFPLLRCTRRRKDVETAKRCKSGIAHSHHWESIQRRNWTQYHCFTLAPYRAKPRLYRTARKRKD